MTTSHSSSPTERATICPTLGHWLIVVLALLTLTAACMMVVPAVCAMSAEYDVNMGFGVLARVLIALGSIFAAGTAWGIVHDWRRTSPEQRSWGLANRWKRAVVYALILGVVAFGCAAVAMGMGPIFYTTEPARPFYERLGWAAPYFQWGMVAAGLLLGFSAGLRSFERERQASNET